MNVLRRALACLLVVGMVLPMPALAAQPESTGGSIHGDPENGFTLVDKDGEEAPADDAWEEEYPYGLLALEYGQLTVTENGPEVVLKVYRLGASEGKVTAVLQYMPAVTQNEDGSSNFDSAISADDIQILVEDPLPIAAYQPWGMAPDPEETDVAVIDAQGTDGEGQACILLSLDLEEAAEDYQWYAKSRGSGQWEEIVDARSAALPVGDEELAEYDFRCVFTLDGVRYCTDSFRGEEYIKPEPQALPPIPEDLELNPEPTYTALDLSLGESAYDGLLFKVTFAQGEYEKEIRISARDDELAEMDEFATLTLVGSVGGDVLESMNTLLLRVADDDQAAAESAQVGFVDGSLSFDKSEGTASITVRRTGGTTQALSVDWALEAGTALPGVDYTDASGTLTFYGAQTEQTIEIELINDQVEDLEERTFTVRLSNLLGDDGSSISADACVVGLYNTNTAEDLNLSSTLYDVEAVDVSGGLTEAEDAPMHSGTVTGTQVPRGEAGTGTVDWGDDGDISLLSWDYNDGNAITFSGGTWGSTERVSQSITSRGNNSTTETIENMSQLYYRFSTWATGSAEFASGGNRFLYGDEEYAYTYFQVEGGSSTFYGDVEPEFYRSGFLGININLRYRSGFSVSGDLAFGDTYNRLVLGTKKHDRCNADSDITSTATTTLYRRVFNNPFYLTLYTANDENVDGVAHYAPENYGNIIQSISLPSDQGGTDGSGRLYEGSTVEIKLGETHLNCTEAYLTDANGKEVAWGTRSGNTITFSDLIADPNGTYTFHLVLERGQDVEIDVTTSTLPEGVSTGESAEAANQAAYELLLAKSTTDGEITVGFTPTASLTATDVPVQETTYNLKPGADGVTFDEQNGVVRLFQAGMGNIQWVNFHLSAEDVIVLNGKSYAGDAKIPLDTSSLSAATLRFYFYEEEFLTVERPMKATIDAVALYFDADGNGQIDGYYDRTLGTFVLDEDSGDYFVAWMDGDYEETDFQPVVDAEGKAHQYFLRPYYTANAVAFTVPEGHSVDEKMQVMPSFITDVTSSSAYEALTSEQKEYRTIVSGVTTIADEDGTKTTGHSADDHLKYTAAATAYSYVDIPLGGDKAPAHAAKPSDLGIDSADGKHTGTDGREYQVLDGQVYYYSATAPSNLGDAVYIWKPDYVGSLLYPYAAPASITIEKSIAGNNIAIAGEDNLTTRYQKTDDTWTTETPTPETASQYKRAGSAFTGNGTLTGGLSYVTRQEPDDKGIDKLNAYLGSFGGNDTFALTVQEQAKTTGEILAEQSGSGISLLADGEEAEKKTETVTRGTVGTFPNSDYLKQNSGSGGGGTADSSGKGAYEEFSTDASPELFSFSSEALGVLAVETDGYEVSFSFGLPVYGKDAGGGTGSATDTFTDVSETAGKIRDFIKAVKNGQTEAYRNLLGKDDNGKDELDASRLSSKSIEFTVNVAFAITLKYNTLDNTYVFSEGALTVSAGIEIRLQYRFTPVPILYVYAQFSLGVSAATGLGQDRLAVLDEEHPILRNAEVKLSEAGTADQPSQYYFTTEQKGFQLTFSGRVYMEAYTFQDGEGGKPGVYEPEFDTLGEPMEGVTSGYLSSDGSEPTEVVLLAQDGFELEDPVVVVLTVMDDGEEDTTATATLTSLLLITDVKKDIYWTGLNLGIEGAIELGLGVGIEIAKFEVYAKASVALAIGFGQGLGSESGGTPASFDEFTLSLGLGFRVVFLFFNYEQDLISYTLTYDGDKWSQSWSALGGTQGGDLPEPGARALFRDGDGGTVEVHITPPSRVSARVYDNGVTGQSAITPFAFDPTDDTVPFQVSGYGSSVNAFTLVDGLETGYDYQIVTVGDDNYVVYTGTNEGSAAEVDGTELWLSKLQVTASADGEDAYGFVSPVAGNTTGKDPVPVDGDGTGDLDFYAWAEGDTIHVIWVSYASKGATATPPSGSPYGNMNKENYETVATPAGGTYSSTDGTYTVGDVLVIDGITVTSANYNTIAVQAPAAGTAPRAEDYYTTTKPDDMTGWTEITVEGEGLLAPSTTYYIRDSYNSLEEAQAAYQEALDQYNNAQSTAQTNYQSALAALANWKSYFAWYAYFSSSDIQNQVTAASRNTVVKHAAFDTTDEDAGGFTGKQVISPASEQGKAYYFLPQSAGNVAVYAQSVPYSAGDLEARLGEYSEYLDDTSLINNGTTVIDNAGYLNSSKAYRLSYQESLLSVYGGNSRLTITGADGTPYTNGTMYVSNHQERLDGTATDQTNEILTNLDITQIGETYYLSYVTQQDYFEQSGTGTYTDLISISRLYLRTFTVADDTVTWGEPYLLRTVLNAEQDSSQDGVYANGALPGNLGSISNQYTDAYLANVAFLTAKLGDKLPEGETGTFEPFSLKNGEVEEETFLLFEMNGNTYVIRQESLVSITQGDGEGNHTGTVNPFFTYDQIYGDAIAEGSTENLSSGKSEVVIGADGDGNVAAVYTSSVPNTVNNAIYIAYWDPVDGSWSSGVMLAMNSMEVYERSIAQGWDDATTEAAYFDEHQNSDEYAGGDFTQLLFSNLQIALGRPAAEGGEVVSGGAGISSIGANSALDTLVQKETESASKLFQPVIETLGLPKDEVTDENGDSATQLSLSGYEALPSTAASPFSAGALLSGSNTARQYAVLDLAERMGVDTGAKTSHTSELLILTQGAFQELEEREVDDGSGKTVIVPTSTDGVADRAQVGLYVISYGKGEQQVGNAYIQFAYDEFTTGKQLYATVSFANVGDAAIRGSGGQPITVALKVHTGEGEDQELTSWEIEENIAAGQTVRLATDDAPCAPLTQDLGYGDYFYLTVEEYKEDGYIDDPYIYNSSNDQNCHYVRLVESRPELGVENLTASASGVEQNGDVAVDVSFDVTNRGDARAEDVFVQFTYFGGEYDKNGQPVYEPLNITGSDLFVSQEQIITSGIRLMSATQDNYSIGVIMLDTDDTYYTSDYYISADRYNEILGQYYSTTEKDDWEKGEYNGLKIWYDKLYYGSAYAAYAAGQEAVAHWVHDAATGNYYSDQYDSFDAAKAAADAARKAEYILTAEQYKALSESEQDAWKAAKTPEDEGAETVYIPVSYQTYDDAYKAYEDALNATGPQIRQNYLRTVEGTLYVDPDKFNGRATGSLDLRVEVFSQASEADYHAGTGVYTSDHSDEYYAINNRAEAQVEQKTFVSAADRVVLGQYGAHRLAVSIRTTTGEAPSIRVLEVEDGHGELGTLSFTPNDDTDGVPSTLTGYLTVVGNELGEGVIHIVDDATNTTYPIVYRVDKSGDGINIFNDDAQFTFYNADKSLFDPTKPAGEQSWTFQDTSEWGKPAQSTYLGNLSIGEKGASFTFETQGSEFTFDLIGEATVTSDRFPGSWTIGASGEGETEADLTADRVDFGNDQGVTHTVTVTITSDRAWFDIVRVAYTEGYTPSDDANAPGLYFDRSFPTANSVAEDGGGVKFTVYAVDDSGLQSLSVTGDCVKPDAGQPVKTDDGLWAYTFTVTENGTFTAAATDTSGNTTNRSITVDWFTDGTPQGQAGAPELTATIKKYDSDGSELGDVIANPTLTVTEEDTKNGVKVKFDASSTTEPAPDITYYRYNETTDSFAEVTLQEITVNGYYMVQADSSDSYNTFSRRIFYVGCFELLPVFQVSTQELTDPNGLNVEWTVSKDAESTAVIESVTVNGIGLLSGETAQAAGSQWGSFQTYYGGIYTFAATDTRGVTGTHREDLTVPVDVSAATITTIDPWGQPDDTGARYGSITIDFTNVTGGDYANTEPVTSLSDYYGSYEYLVLTRAEYEEYEADGDLSELDSLGWKAAVHDATATWDGLTAPAGGSTDYVLLVRDAQNKTEYSTMAVHDFTLTDNAVDYTSLSASLASTPGVNDGKVYVSADKGETGHYEFAILPVEEGSVLTVNDFKAGAVTWVPAEWDDLNSGVLTGLAEGRYQVAIRALYADEEKVDAMAAAGEAAEAAGAALETLLRQREDAAGDMVRAIAAASGDWMDAEAALEEAQEALEALQNSETATDEQIAAAQAAVSDAETAVTKAETAYDAALNGLTEAQKENLKDLRAAWQATPEGDERETARAAYDEAVEAACQGYQETQYESQIAAAEEAVKTTAAAYEAAAGAVTAASATAYSTDEPSRWDSLLTGANLQISVRSGEGSALRASPSVASSATEADGSILVTAEGGSAYDGGNTVHYQFAILPLEEEEDAVDYSGDMTALADLDWQFADDTVEAPDEILFDGLTSGWYQVFVRVVYDPDITEDPDVNTQLAQLAALRADYETALEAAEEDAISDAADAAHSLYLAWVSAEEEDKAAAEAALRAALGGTAAEQQAVLDLADVWNAIAEEDKDAKAEAYESYRAALTGRMEAKAQAELSAANQTYTTLRDTLSAQVALAYKQTPGYYDTASFASAYVGVYVAPSRITDTEYGDGEVTYTIRPTGNLTTNDMRKIYNSNQDLVVHLIRGDLHIVLPVGILDYYREAGEVFSSYRGGSGNVVEYTDEEGVATLNAISLVENGTVAYVYLGQGTYRVVENHGAFDDIAGHWAEGNILFTADREIFRGMEDGLFHSETTMTRAMAITVLHRMLGEPASSAEVPFTDVPEGAWYMDALRWAYETGVVGGVTPDRFAPDQPMTREQLVTVLYRFLRQFGFGAAESAELDGFVDSAAVGEFAVDAFRWAVATDVVGGVGGGRLAPQSDATRAQIAAVCERMIRYILA